MEVKYISNTHDDLIPVNAARVSMHKHHDTFVTDEMSNAELSSDEKLLNYLANHNHWTPFSHAREAFHLPISEPEMLHFLMNANLAGFVYAPYREGYLVKGSIWGWAKEAKHVPLDCYGDIINTLVGFYPHSMKAILGEDMLTRSVGCASHVTKVDLPKDLRFAKFHDVTCRVKAPIYIRTQCYKHKHGFTENEISRRYVDFEPEFYVPSWRMRAQNVKQGSAAEADQTIMAMANKSMMETLHASTDSYSDLLALNISPEQARGVLPQAMSTEWYWTGNLEAYLRFYQQRSDSHAQKEIQELASMIDDILTQEVGEIWTALKQDGI